MTKEQLKSVAENLVSIFETCNKVGADQSLMEQCQYELNKYALKKLQEEGGCCNFCNFGSIGTNDGIFNIDYCKGGKLEILNSKNDYEDIWDINFCPMCGRRLRKDENML